MSDMLIGKANLNNFNIGLNDFMQEYKKNVNDIQNGEQGSGLGKIPNTSLDNINMPDDPELANDLKVLMKDTGTGLSNSDLSTKGLSSDNTVNSFGKVLTNYLNDVNNTQLDADKKAEFFASGGNIDVHSVMIAHEKAGLAMQLTMQLRNKILMAYQEVNRMNV